MKAEYLIPTFIGELLADNKMSVKVLRSNDTWYGMTYKEDVVAVKESFKEMLEAGVYREDLFSDLQGIGRKRDLLYRSFWLSIKQMKKSQNYEINRKYLKLTL